MRKASKVLVVDDEMTNRLLLKDILSPLGYNVVEASDGDEALQITEREKPDIILLDVIMPRLNGYEVCRQLKSSPRTKLIPIIILTSLDQLTDKIMAVDLGADDFINKPFNLTELTARVKALVALKHYTDELEYVYDVLKSITMIVERKDAYTHNHCKNVEFYAVSIARELGLSDEDVHVLRLGAAFHDIGKIGISDEILQKPAVLSVQEMEIMKTHTIIGTDLLRPMKTLEKALPLIRHHHERLDGSGYPDRLKGNDISTPIRILSVVDIYEALISIRPYKNGMPHTQAMEILYCEAKKGWWDIDIIRMLDRLMKDKQSVND